MGTGGLTAASVRRVMSFDLLSYVQPEGGWYAIAGIRGDEIKQRLVETPEEVEALVGMFVAQKRNVFFGLAKYRDKTNRKKENVLGLKAFWLDMDCGPGKDYVDQLDALTALRAFCKATGLPKPTLVDSGYGIHVYWTLSETISREQWEPVAARLRAVCTTQGLKVDAKVFEVARVLRVPGTYNFKGETPVEVKVINVGPKVPFADFCATLGTTPPAPARNIFDPNYKATARETAMLSGIDYSFKRILKRSLEGEGCAQILWAVENGATADYNEWFYTLSVAAMCKDAEKAIHVVSQDHPDYDPVAVEVKVESIKKATSCKRFEEYNPERCKGCKFKGKIFGPRELGVIPKKASTNRVTVEVGPDEFEELQIPEYPRPFYRGEGGGIWHQPPSDPRDEAPAEPRLVYKNDFYAVKRLHDKGEGDSVLFRLHLRHDGIREFAVPMTKVSHNDELRRALAAWGVVARKNNFALLAEYVLLSIENLQDNYKAEVMRHQFGWADKDGRFVLGDQEITPVGNVYSPPSKTTSKLAKFIGPVGRLEDWQEVWKVYNLPGMEPHAFAALSGFGAPLLKFFNQTGAVINLYNSRSGTGKTTVLNMVNSIWGHPKELRLKLDDTMNGRLMWVGILNNLPATMDELTNATPLEYSNFLYALSNGKGKERMMAGSNELRENNTTWQTITVSSSNASFAEKLAILKNNPEGELMRLFEYPVSLVEHSESENVKYLFDTVLLNNYGHAGPIFIRYVMDNMDYVLRRCASIQAKIDRELQLQPRERFWSATVAANMVGGLLAKECGLIDWDLKRIYQWACERIQSMRTETTPPLQDVNQVVGEYVYRHMQNILVVDGLVDRRTKGAPLPKREPKGELLIRIEPDSKMMFVIAKKFKEHCVNYQINYNETIRVLTENGKLVKHESKRLGTGMSGVSGNPVHCIWFKLDDDFINVSDYVESPKDGD